MAKTVLADQIRETEKVEGFRQASKMVVGSDGKTHYEEPSDYYREHGICSQCGAKFAEGWQPIRTAPKDGRDYIVTWTPEGLDLCRWSDGEPDGPQSMGHDPGWWGHRSAAAGRSFGNPKYRSEPQGQPTWWLPTGLPPLLPEEEKMKIDKNKPVSLRLRDLADHLAGLDSGSGEAALFREAAERLDTQDGVIDRHSPCWKPINSAPLSDDLIWLLNSASQSIEGPRPLFEYDADKFDYWARCEPPPSPPQPPEEWL